MRVWMVTSISVFPTLTWKTLTRYPELGRRRYVHVLMFDAFQPIWWSYNLDISVCLITPQRSADILATRYSYFLTCQAKTKHFFPVRLLTSQMNLTTTTHSSGTFGSPGNDWFHHFSSNNSFTSRLLFVVLFENLVAVTVMILRLAIPDVSSDLKYKIRREVIYIGIDSWTLDTNWPFRSTSPRRSSSGQRGWWRLGKSE